MQCVGCQFCGVALGGAQPAELLLDVLCTDACGAEQRQAAQEAHCSAASSDRGTTTASVEASVLDQPVWAIGVERDGDADQVPTCCPAGSPRVGVRGRVPLPD